ncbi:unnamed protein product [Symbiodinium natans]|uniref:Uncharacterized protein n=1 Tax=Symbiodinium natans TaxID=878477 RepID=A0A812QNK8_9DINO|nr:unnamed protein product [Symbiodinium natans]
MTQTVMLEDLLGGDPSSPIVRTREPLWRVRHLRPRRPPSQLGKPPPVTVKTRSEVPLPLKTSGESSGECGEPSFLAFGDAVRLTLPPLAAGGLAAALCACVRPKAVGDVGPREIVPTDAEREELRLAEDLASSGRRAKDFVAVTAARVPDPEVVVRRSAWRVFRCSELDGFPAGSRVHYGQHLHFGLPSVDDADSEILLSCEPPSRCGGLGAPYLILGRFVDFGHVCQGRRSWNTAFTMVPEDASSSAGGFGDPVDLRCGVRIIPIAPFSYLHGPRLMQAVFGGLSNPVGRGCISRCAAVGKDVRELLLHASAPDGEPPDVGWVLERLCLTQGTTSPPAGADTTFARWHSLRAAIQKRIRRRGEALAYSTFRKILSKDCLVLDDPISTNRLPAADGAVTLAERTLVGESSVLTSLRCDYGVQLGDADMQLITKHFRPPGTEALWSEPVIDANAFADALRGETSPGRSRTLQQLYSLLQKQAGLKPPESLSVAWIRARVESMEEGGQLFPAGDLLASLPLVRSHAGITRLAFLRWQMDALALIPAHESCLGFLYQSLDARCQKVWFRVEDLFWVCQG